MNKTQSDLIVQKLLDVFTSQKFFLIKTTPNCPIDLFKVADAIVSPKYLARAFRKELNNLDYNEEKTLDTGADNL